MFYIKLDRDMSLTITVSEPLYRGDNLNRKIIYLIPLQVGNIDMLTAYVYLNYIRSDGVADVAVLERLEEKYNESYYQYTFPVTCKLTKFPGEVCTWMTIYTGNPSNPTVSKSGECLLQIRYSKNIDDCLCDHQLTALYQMQKRVDDIPVRDAPVRTIDKTLFANGWVNGQQSLSIDGLGAVQNGTINFSNSITPTQRADAMNARLMIQGQSEGTLTIVSSGIIPTCDIPVTITLFP